MIEFRDVVRSYESGGRQIHALRGVTLNATGGEFLALVGRSGSGKSTLLNLACGIDQPDSGDILLAGTSLSALRDHDLTLLRRTRIGMIFQFFNLIPTLTALENVALPAYLAGTPGTSARKRAWDLIGEMGLAGRETEFPDNLSGGEQQRLAIARAIINNPDVILADEPTGNLDSETGEFVLQRLRALATDQGKTVLMVTHSAEALAHVDRVVRLRDGLVVDS